MTAASAPTIPGWSRTVDRHQLHPADTASPQRRRPSLHERQVLRRAAAPTRDHQRWLDHTAATRGCIRPVRLAGELHTVEQTTGAILETRHTTTACPDGVIYLPCGDRRASVCPPCAETYRADTYQLIRAGLVGGKGVPDTVAGHPAVFATPTAPSFGPVHTRAVHPRTGKVRPCHPRRRATVCPHGRLLACTQRHTEKATCLGRPLCLDCYDHEHHVMWNGWAGELWRRTTIALNRLLKPLGEAHGVKIRVSYCKVAEHQRRGVVHFHALIRLDAVNPDDPDAILAPPAAITAEQLAELLEQAVTATSFHTPAYPGTDISWLIEWGRQLDIRPVSRIGSGAITSEAVAGYLAKYATKATEPTGLPVTARLNGETVQHYTDSRTHLGRLIAYAWELGAVPADHTTDQQRQDWHDTYGRLRRWAHMLGFGGHFATKSRRYSTTHKALRAARRTWRRSFVDQRRRDRDEHGEETTLIVTALTLAGIGWNTTADAQLAASAAARAREQRQTAKDERMTQLAS